MSVRVRYAPSPTGLQHIGGIRTALFNYFFARANGGTFILRIEDTDQERSTAEALDDLYETLNWLNVEWDEGPIIGGPYGPYIQSERTEIYKAHAQMLVDQGKAYHCFCDSERLQSVREQQMKNKEKHLGYDRHCRSLTSEEVSSLLAEGKSSVIRLKVPLEGKTTFHDMLMGDISRANVDVNPDPVLLKSDGFPTYHLANVIDDHMMGITHILRAQEWIPSGPLHVLLYEAFGWQAPLFCHLPMVMGKDGQKLSKRHGSTSVREFKEQGYLPEALMNYVSLVGWAYDGEKEFFTKEELSTLFILEKISKSPGVFDYKKLEWYNGMYIRQKDDDSLISLLEPYLQQAAFIATPPTNEERELLYKLLPLVKERLKKLEDVVPLVRFLFEDITQLEVADLLPKKQSAEQTLLSLERALPIIDTLNKENLDEVENALVELASTLEIKVQGVFMPLRVAITGSAVSPPLLDSILLLGLKNTKARLQRAITLLKAEVLNV
ncbi:MAG: glutamate--tRNA ligase [Sphaerochaetaceae bacterium]|jgi:glutamyl-tRNA synthetase